MKTILKKMPISMRLCFIFIASSALLGTTWVVLYEKAGLNIEILYNVAMYLAYFNFIVMVFGSIRVLMGDYKNIEPKSWKDQLW